MNTLTRIDISKAIAEEIGFSHTHSSQLVKAILLHITHELVNGEVVKIAGFGKFSIRSKKARMGRNPKTGAEIPIHARRIVVFSPSKLFKERVETALSVSKGLIP